MGCSASDSLRHIGDGRDLIKCVGDVAWLLRKKGEADHFSFEKQL